MEKVIACLESLSPVSPELKSHLRNIIKQKVYGKNEHLLRYGQRCDKIWFIEKGIAACFYEKNGKTQCAWFTKENDFCTSVNGFITAAHSTEDIVALDEVETYYISRADLHTLYLRFPEFIFHGARMIIHYCMAAEQRMRAFHNQPPMYRYQYLLEHQPELITRVMVKDIARYLGMHPDALSKLRASIG